MKNQIKKIKEKVENKEALELEEKKILEKEWNSEYVGPVKQHYTITEKTFLNEEEARKVYIDFYNAFVNEFDGLIRKEHENYFIVDIPNSMEGMTVYMDKMENIYGRVIENKNYIIWINPWYYDEEGRKKARKIVKRMLEWCPNLLISVRDDPTCFTNSKEFIEFAKKHNKQNNYSYNGCIDYGKLDDLWDNNYMRL